MFHSFTQDEVRKPGIGKVSYPNTHHISNLTESHPFINPNYFVKEEHCLIIASNLVGQRGISIWDAFIKCLFPVAETRHNYFHIWKLLKETYPDFPQLRVKKQG